MNGHGYHFTRATGSGGKEEVPFKRRCCVGGQWASLTLMKWLGKASSAISCILSSYSFAKAGPRSGRTSPLTGVLLSEKTIDAGVGAPILIEDQADGVDTDPAEGVEADAAEGVDEAADTLLLAYGDSAQVLGVECSDFEDKLVSMTLSLVVRIFTLHDSSSSLKAFGVDSWRFCGNDPEERRRTTLFLGVLTTTLRGCTALFGGGGAPQGRRPHKLAAC